MLKCYWHAADTILRDDGVLTLDGSDLLKKGKESIGVKGQYRGAVGRHAHRQAGVFLSYASRYGSTLLDRRLYLSQEWTEDAASTQPSRRGVLGGSRKCNTVDTSTT